MRPNLVDAVEPTAPRGRDIIGVIPQDILVQVARQLVGRDAGDRHGVAPGFAAPVDLGDSAGGVDERELPGLDDDLAQGGWIRSEEHTSELQSLMRISYAVFCLKKKKTQT